MAQAFRARWVFPVSGPPLADACVTVQHGRIMAVGAPADGAAIVDLGMTALLPGLVNAHTHLEFSDFARPLGRPGVSFPRWIGKVIQSRARTAPGLARDEFRQASVRLGLDESSHAGVAAIGEIATLPWFAEPFETEQAAVHATVFLELIGLRRARLPALLRLAREHLEAGRGKTWRPGLSPHAPYSVHPDLVEAIARLAAEFQAPVAMHLAETHGELKLLERGRSGLVRYFYARGIWQPQIFRGGRRIRDYLQVLSAAHRALIIHGNYLTSADHELLAAARDRMSVVYCPRTHAYFRHPRYPLPQALATGVRVALGTDSRASNPDLSLFEEMRYVARRYRELPGAEVVAMGTLRGAEALGLAESLGTLEPGKLAALTVVPLPTGDGEDPHQLLWRGAAARRVRTTDGRDVTG